MTRRRLLVLDLDGTLLHMEPAADAIVVPGRTRPAFLAGRTVTALAALASRYDIVLATGRSWHGTRPVADGLRARGVEIAAVIVEDGARLGTPAGQRALAPELPWRALRRALDAAIDPAWPHFEWQDDFESCLVARAESRDAAARLAPLLAAAARARQRAPRLRSFRDGRKVYLVGEHADKWTALCALAGERARRAAGVGDGANDLCWLSRIGTPCTLAGAAGAVVDAVRRSGGWLASAAGHEGIAEILRRLDEAGAPA